MILETIVTRAVIQCSDADRANGPSCVESVSEIIAAYPYLEPEDVHEALRYAAWLAEENVFPVEAVSP